MRKYTTQDQRREWGRRATLKRSYRMTPEDYARRLAEQGGKCQTCGRDPSPTPQGRRFVVDHCHTTGRVRGLLCYRCNAVIGMAGDSPTTLRTLAEYVERNQTP